MEKVWGISFVVSPTALLQALTISQCFAHSQDSESLYFHLRRRYLHLVCIVRQDGAQFGIADVMWLLALLLWQWQRNPPSKQHSFMPLSHKILVLLLKVWALFQGDFQDCRQGGGATLNVNLECQLWQLRASRYAQSAWGRVQRLQVQRSAVQGAREQSLMCCLSLPGPNLFLRLSVSQRTVVSSRNSGPTESQGGWSLAHFFLSFYSFGIFVVQATSKSKTTNQSQFEETNAIKKILSIWQTLYFPSGTTPAAFYKLFPLGSSVTNIDLNPLIPSLNDFS